MKDAVRRRVREAMQGLTPAAREELVDRDGEYVGPPRARMFNDPEQVSWREATLASLGKRRLHRA